MNLFFTWNYRKRPGPFFKTVDQYAEATSIHAIPYIFDKEVPVAERILWICLLGVGMALVIYNSLKIYASWKDNPVLTTVSKTGLPISEIEYPTITICAEGSVDETTGKNR